MKKKLIIVIIASVIVLIAATCTLLILLNKGNTPDKPDEQITPTNYTLAIDKTEYTCSVDQEFYLKATTNAKGVITWSCSDKSIATVDANGRVLTKKAGTVTITAAVADLLANCSVTVTQTIESEEGKIKVANSVILSLKEGAVKIEPQFVDQSGSPIEGKTFAFSSDNTDIATISQDGVITPQKLGKTIVFVECEKARVSVIVDVYTAPITTTDEWMKVISESAVYPERIKPTERYYLKNDLDFTDVEYDLGGTFNGQTGMKEAPNIFASEINGNFHTVKNITKWKYDKDKNPNNHQSVFGKVIGGKVRNINLENIVFNSTNSYGLASVLMQHFTNTVAGEIVNVFENVVADFSYQAENGQFATGVTCYAYGATFNNVIVRMRSADESKQLSDMFSYVYGYSYYEGVWYGGSLTNVITIVEDMPADKIQFIDEEKSNQYKHIKSNCYTASTVVEAVYYANQILDQSVWNTENPTSVPSFR